MVSKKNKEEFIMPWVTYFKKRKIVKKHLSILKKH